MIDPQKEIPELSEEEILRIEEERVNKTSDPFYPPVIDNYCNERVPTDTLTREYILELGFLRSNPDRKIYQHKDKPTLFLEEIFEKNYSVKDYVVRVIQIYKYNSGEKTFFYSTIIPNKEDIQLIVNSYTG